MGTFRLLLITYVLGGLTFIPLILALILLHAHLTLPKHDPTIAAAANDAQRTFLHDPSDDEKNIKSGADALAHKFQSSSSHDPDVAEGYFAVCREYVPGGVNGKPPERTTPAGEVVVEESPSVYQSMYHSIFNRKQLPSLDAGVKVNGKVVAKRARNVFYVVLRHGHLMLYDDSEQVEVRHVISLAYHDVDVYGGGENAIPEGELWIKRNAIRLRRKAEAGDVTTTSKPFFFFSENCSDKEDFYFALLQNQERNENDLNSPPRPLSFEVKDVVSLVQRLHANEEQLQTRWINALIGRLFLGVYKTQVVEDFVRMKITKKISRVKKPSFISGIVLQKIDLGESAPLFTNPRLKDLTVNGDCCVEVDIKYSGGFRIEIAATVRIDLGTRFKAREVNIVLALVIKKLEGHMLIKFKPPPSNRAWITFETMPHIEMSIEPIVSSRQITYSVILRAIESRIREVIAESLVLPFWDDSPFMDTDGQQYRGGIWTSNQKDQKGPDSNVVPDEVAEDEAEVEQDTGPTLYQTSKDDRTLSLPLLDSGSSSKLIPRRGHKSTHSLVDSADTATTSGLSRLELPKAMRSHSFASAAEPLVSTDHVRSDSIKSEAAGRGSKDAASFMTELSTRSQPTSPVITPLGSLDSKSGPYLDAAKQGSFSSLPPSYTDTPSDHSVPTISTSASITDPSFPPSPTTSTTRSINSTTSSNTDNHSQKFPNRLQSIAKSVAAADKKQYAVALGSAANAAKQWGWNALQKRTKSAQHGPSSSIDEPKLGTPDHPIGQGQPLPPPGMPLPLPTKPSTPVAAPKRKPIPAAKQSVPSPQLSGQLERNVSDVRRRPVAARPNPLNRRSQSNGTTPDEQPPQTAVFVVEAPMDMESPPASPTTTTTLHEDESPQKVTSLDKDADADDGFGDFMDNVLVEDEVDDEESSGEQSGNMFDSGVTPRASENGEGLEHPFVAHGEESTGTTHDHPATAAPETEYDRSSLREKDIISPVIPPVSKNLSHESLIQTSAELVYDDGRDS